MPSSGTGGTEPPTGAEPSASDCRMRVNECADGFTCIMNEMESYSCVSSSESGGTETPAGVEPPATPAGGTDDGGTPAGGTDDGGVAAGGTDDGGVAAGGFNDGGFNDGGSNDGGSEIVGPGDTDPLACGGDYCPSARLSNIIFPATTAEAAMRNCNVQGSNNGSGLGQLLTSLASFIGEINPTEYVQPDENGEISLILLSHLSGWEIGQTGNSAGELNAQTFNGHLNDDNSFDLHENTIHSFSGTTIRDGLLITPTLTEFSWYVSGVSVTLNQVQVTGNVTVDEIGFSLNNGTLGGYLTQDSIDDLIDAFVEICSGTPPESVTELCSGLDSIGGPEAAAGILQSILTYDSTVDTDGSVTSCPAGTPACNAISVCLAISMESANISGTTDVVNTNTVGCDCNQLSVPPKSRLFHFVILLIFLLCSRLWLRMKYIYNTEQ
jgi:hypothetical protein